MLIDWSLDQPVGPPRLPVAWLSREQAAAELHEHQRRQAMATAYEAELILRLAELRSPGASSTWRGPQRSPTSRMVAGGPSPASRPARHWSPTVTGSTCCSPGHPAARRPGGGRRAPEQLLPGGEYGLAAAVGQGRAVEAVIDPMAGTLVLRTTEDGQVVDQQSDPLPADFDHRDWHSLVLEIRDGVATAELTHARLFDPVATLELAVPAGTATGGQAGAVTRIHGAQVDDLSAPAGADLVTERVTEPEPGAAGTGRTGFSAGCGRCPRTPSCASGSSAPG